MASTSKVSVKGTGLIGEPGDKIVRDEDGTLRLVKAADLPAEPDCDDEGD
jgi:hypothetical protein